MNTASGAAGSAPQAPSGAKTVDILGTHFRSGPFASVVDEICALRGGDQSSYVCIGNVHTVMEARTDERLAASLEGAALATTDGMPLVWSARRAGNEAAERAYGPDVLAEVTARGATQAWTHFFMGGGPGVADAVAAELKNRHPDFECVGAVCPPFGDIDELDYESILSQIEAAKPDFVWVGLGMPKQEKWMAKFAPRCSTSAVFVGVGAAFDFFGGEVRQAPPVLQRAGLEWLFRLAMEPRRLAHRYLIVCSPFVYRILRKPPRLVDAAST